VRGTVDDASPPRGEGVVRAPVVTEQRHRQLDVADHRGPTERRGALHRDLRDHADRVVEVLVWPELEPVARPLGQGVGVTDVRARPAPKRSPGLRSVEVPGPVGAPRARRWVTEAGRQVLLLPRAVVEIGGDERIGGHGSAG